MLQSGPTQDVSSSVYRTLWRLSSLHVSFVAISWMLATERFSLGRHQMGKHHNQNIIESEVTATLETSEIMLHGQYLMPRVELCSDCC